MLRPEVLFSQSAACGFFARIFRPGLDLSLLRRCAEERMLEAWVLGDENGEARDALGALAASLADLDDGSLAQIEQDNAALFVGPEDPVPLWESVWTSKDRLLFADCEREVRLAFEREGLEAPNAACEPADHLSYELSFVAALLARAGQSVEAGDMNAACRQIAAAAVFLDEHLAPCAHDCLAEVGRRAATSFYRAAALLLADTLSGLQGLCRAGS